MADNMYPKAKEKFLNGQIDMDAVSWTVLLLTGHSYDSADEFIPDLVADEMSGSGYARQALANVTLALDGTAVKFDADDVSFVGVTAGTSSHAVLAVNTGEDATSSVVLNFEVVHTFDGATYFLVPDATGLLRAD